MGTVVKAMDEKVANLDSTAKTNKKNKKQRNSLENVKERIESKKRRIAAATEGVGDMIFTVPGFSEEATAEEESVERGSSQRRCRRNGHRECIRNSSAYRYQS